MFITDDTDLLEKLVKHLATLYDQGEECLDFDGEPVSDPEYDELVKELYNRRPTSDAFEGTSPSQYQPTGKTVTHNPPITSIAKADGTLAQKTTVYEKWLKDCCNKLGYEYPPNKGRFAQSYKHDGVAIRLYYKKGKLVAAGLRPRNGVYGVEVTANVQYVKGIPTQLPIPVTLAIGGELECYLSEFAKVQKTLKDADEKLRKNPRNHTFGGINQHKDPSKTKDARISFIGYTVVGFDDSAKYYKTEVERAKWMNKTLGVKFIQVREHQFEDLAMLEGNVKELDYEVDGVVLKVNNLEDQEQLGHHGDNPIKEPRGALAWKFAEEHKQAKVKELQWGATRTGRVPPVAIFEEGIQLAGTTVSKATCSNFGWVERMGIGVGTIVDVYKAGKIIPKINDVVSGKVSKIVYPTKCPACDQKLSIVHGAPPNKELMCENKNCPAKQVVGIEFFLATLGAKGLGQSGIEKILSKGKVKDFSDLFTLEVDDLMESGLSERQSLLALGTIHLVEPINDDNKQLAAIKAAKKKKKLIPAWQFFASLGIPGSGQTAGKTLIDAFGSLEAIMDATEDELLAVQGIGEKAAPIIVAYFKQNRKIVDKLLEHIELELPKIGKLSGKTFVLTGSFDEGKTSIQKKIENLGGKCSGSVSKTTHYLVVGADPGSKVEKADKYGVTKLSVKELEKML